MSTCSRNGCNCSSNMLQTAAAKRVKRTFVGGPMAGQTVAMSSDVVTVEVPFEDRRRRLTYRAVIYRIGADGNLYCGAA